MHRRPQRGKNEKKEGKVKTNKNQWANGEGRERCQDVGINKSREINDYHDVRKTRRRTIWEPMA